MTISLVGRVFANGLGDEFNPRTSHTKDSKNGNPEKGVALSLHLSVTANEMGAFDYSHQLTFFYFLYYMYIM